MKFVFVHGAWHGGWVWQETIRILERHGHTCFAGDLPGLLDRWRPDTPQGADLESHIDTAVNWIDAQSIGGDPIVLVGHSYGGMVISGAADRRCEKIERLIYLDAYVPDNNMAWRDFHTAERAEARIRDSISLRDYPEIKYIDPPTGKLARDSLGIPDPVMATEVEHKLKWHPLNTYLQPIRINGPLDKFRRTYIDCCGNLKALRDTDFDALKSRLRGDGSWTYHQIPAGHDVMVTNPGELADLLCNPG